MRPLRIEIEGFMAYRSLETMNLEDVDLFALTGPTGAGKSTIIDAMVFALYGKTPRFGGHAPGQVVNASSDWGRVQFDFSLGDRTYTVARRIERERGVTEASLVEGDRSLANGSKEVGETIPGILGLEYDHFVRAVVLPQGKFARFLSDKPAERQDLLRALLDIGLFDQVKVLANQRAAAAQAAATSAALRLEKLADFTPQMIEDARRRLTTLEEAGLQLKVRLEQIEQASSGLDEAAKGHDTLQGRLAALRKLKVPARLDELATLRTDAMEAVARAAAAIESATARREKAARELSALPDLGELKSWGEAHKSRVKLLERREEIDLGKLSDTCRELEKALVEATGRLEELHTANAAHGLREGLAVGDLCPVCAQRIEDLPDGDAATSDDIADAEFEVTAARRAFDEARSARDKAEGEHETITVQIDELATQLAKALGPEEVATQIETVTETAAALEDARKAESEATSRHEQARVDLESVEKQLGDLKSDLVSAIARIEAEDPPTPTEDTIESWQALDIWRAQRVATLEADVSEAGEQVATLKSDLKKLTGQMRTWLEGLGLAAGDDPKTTVAVAVERQEQAVSKMEEARRAAGELEAEIDRETSQATVAASLGEHLKANKFEAWLMEEAMDALVEGSNELLAVLSADAYSLDHAGGRFEVIDHFNADQRRSTQSLSGGETFLVSLALSLAMASQLVELSGSSTRLESVFLDEGFGTLDAESLDVVDAVLNELVGQGRTVGIVTHVRDLAERMPVRFEVTKGLDGATISEVRE